MANPDRQTLTKDQWNECAAGIQTGGIWKISSAVEFLYTYREDLTLPGAAPVPTDTGPRVLIGKEDFLPLEAKVPSTFYLKPLGQDGVIEVHA